MLNLLETKEVFSYKASSNHNLQLSNTISQQASHLHANQIVSSFSFSRTGITTSRENLEDHIWLFYKFKSSFYELVYKFPHAHLLKVFQESLLAYIIIKNI